MVEGVAFGEGEGGMEEVHQVFVWSDFFRHLFCRIYNSTALSKRIFNPLYFALQMLIFNAVGLQIRQNKGTRALLTSHIENCAKRTTSSFQIPTSHIEILPNSYFKLQNINLAFGDYFVLPNSYFKHYNYYYENFQRHENLEDYYPVYYYRTHSHHQLVLCAEL